MVQSSIGVSLIKQVAPNFAGVQAQPARIMNRHMDLGEACMKWIIFIMNIFVTLAGAGFIVLGLYIRLEATDYEEFIGSGTSVSWMFVGVGSFLFLVGGIGCCGANKSSPTMLTVYFTLMLAVVFAQFVILMVLISNKDDLKTEINSVIEEKVKEYGGVNKSAIATDPIDFIQKQLECCGVDKGPTDWTLKRNLAVEWVKNTTQSVPTSCCKVETTTCGVNAANSSYNATIWQKGCEEKLYDIWSDNLPIIGGVGGALFGVQIFGLCGAFMLRRAIKENYT